MKQLASSSDLWPHFRPDGPVLQAARRSLSSVLHLPPQIFHLLLEEKRSRKFPLTVPLHNLRSILGVSDTEALAARVGAALQECTARISRAALTQPYSRPLPDVAIIGICRNDRATVRLCVRPSAVLAFTLRDARKLALPPFLAAELHLPWLSTTTSTLTGGQLYSSCHANIHPAWVALLRYNANGSLSCDADLGDNTCPSATDVAADAEVKSQWEEHFAASMQGLHARLQLVGEFGRATGLVPRAGHGTSCKYCQNHRSLTAADISLLDMKGMWPDVGPGAFRSDLQVLLAAKGIAPQRARILADSVLHLTMLHILSKTLPVRNPHLQPPFNNVFLDALAQDIERQKKKEAQALWASCLQAALSTMVEFEQLRITLGAATLVRLQSVGGEGSHVQSGYKADAAPMAEVERAIDVACGAATQSDALLLITTWQKFLEDCHRFAALMAPTSHAAGCPANAQHQASSGHQSTQHLPQTRNAALVPSLAASCTQTGVNMPHHSPTVNDWTNAGPGIALPAGAGAAISHPCGNAAQQNTSTPSAPVTTSTNTSWTSNSQDWAMPHRPAAFRHAAQAAHTNSSKESAGVLLSELRRTAASIISFLQLVRGSHASSINLTALELHVPGTQEVDYKKRQLQSWKHLLQAASEGETSSCAMDVQVDAAQLLVQGLMLQLLVWSLWTCGVAV